MSLYFKHAELEDLQGITECAKRFFEYAEYEKQGLPFDEESFQIKISEYITNHNGIVILLKDDDHVAGGIAGFVGEWGFNNSIRFAVELFYWVDEEYRGKNSVKLLMLYEIYAKSLGAKKSVMISINTDLRNKIKKLYDRMGYNDFEWYSIKSI